MSKEAITLIRDESQPSIAASHLLRATKLAFLEVFPDDHSVKPYLSVSGFAQGFEGFEGIEYFVQSGIWRGMDLRKAELAPDESLVVATLKQIELAEKAFNPKVVPPDVDGLAKIFTAFDELLRSERFEEADEVLRRYEVKGRAASILLAILTATLPAKIALSERASLFRRVKEELSRTGKTDPRLLSGLE